MALGDYKPIFRTREVSAPEDLRAQGFPEYVYAEVWDRGAGYFNVYPIPQFYDTHNGYPDDSQPMPQVFFGRNSKRKSIKAANAMIEDLANWRIGTLTK